MYNKLNSCCDWRFIFMICIRGHPNHENNLELRTSINLVSHFLEFYIEDFLTGFFNLTKPELTKLSKRECAKIPDRVR